MGLDVQLTQTCYKLLAQVSTCRTSNIFGARHTQCAVHVNGFCPLHAGKCRSILQGIEDFGEVVRQLLRIDFCVCTGACGDYEGLTRQLIAVTTVGESVGEDLIQPLLKQRGNRVPEDGELQNDNVRFHESLLFCGDIK